MDQLSSRSPVGSDQESIAWTGTYGYKCTGIMVGQNFWPETTAMGSPRNGSFGCGHCWNRALAPSQGTGVAGECWRSIDDLSFSGSSGRRSDRRHKQTAETA